MQEKNDNLRTLRASLLGLRRSMDCTRNTGFFPTRLSTVKIFWSDVALPRLPLSYEPGIAVIVSGRKVGFLDEHVFTYNAGQYLAVGLPVCFDCETYATPDEPLIGVFLSAEQAVMRDLAAEIFEAQPSALPNQTTLGVEPLAMGEGMRNAVERLVKQLADKTEARVLAPATVREAFFHALQDPHGRALLAQTRPDRPEARIAAALREIEAHPERHKNVAHMAAMSGMSQASFHRHFRAAFGSSPVRYLKRRRLMRAKLLLTEGRVPVARAAQDLGYASPAQFSRDFKQEFNVPPSKAYLLEATEAPEN